MSEHVILEGQLAVRAALRAEAREVHGVYVDGARRLRGIEGLERLAGAVGAAIERVDSEFIAARATGKSHGGVIAVVGPRRFLQLEELLGGDAPLVVMLDGVEDPFTLGHSIRSLYAAGVDGIVLRRRDWSTAEAVVVRSSAGASELAPLALAESADEAADACRRAGLTIACTAKRNATSIYAVDLTGGLFVLIGGERRGITRSFLDKADLLLTVPYGRRFDAALTAGAAAAVIAFEAMRQRKSEKTQ